MLGSFRRYTVLIEAKAKNRKGVETGEKTERKETTIGGTYKTVGIRFFLGFFAGEKSYFALSVCRSESSPRDIRSDRSREKRQHQMVRHIHPTKNRPHESTLLRNNRLVSSGTTILTRNNV